MEKKITFHKARPNYHIFSLVFQGLPLNGVVNAPALSNAHAASNQEWINLATSLGHLAVSLLPTTPTSQYKVNVNLYTETECKQVNNIVLRAALIGILNKGTANGINLVNAPTVAHERGITVETTVTKELPSYITSRSALEIAILKDGQKYNVIGKENVP